MHGNDVAHRPPLNMFPENATQTGGHCSLTPFWRHKCARHASLRSVTNVPSPRLVRLVSERPHTLSARMIRKRHRAPCIIFNPKVHDSRPATAARRPPRDDGPRRPAPPTTAPSKLTLIATGRPAARLAGGAAARPRTRDGSRSHSQRGRDGDGEREGVGPWADFRATASDVNRVMARRGGEPETFPRRQASPRPRVDTCTRLHAPCSTR
jgi:hypothetical protein